MTFKIRFSYIYTNFSLRMTSVTQFIFNGENCLPEYFLIFNVLNIIINHFYSQK